MLPHDHHQGSNNDQFSKVLPGQAKVSGKGAASDKGAEEKHEKSSAHGNQLASESNQSSENIGGENSLNQGAIQHEQISLEHLNHEHKDRELCFRFLVELKALVGEKRFDEWFAHLTTIHLTERVLFVCVASPFLQRWMYRVFHKECQQVLLNLLGPGLIVEFQVKETGSANEGLTYHELKELLFGQPGSASKAGIVNQTEPTNQVDNGRNSERIGDEDLNTHGIKSNEQEKPRENLPDKDARGSQDDPAGNFSMPKLSKFSDEHRSKVLAKHGIEPGKLATGRPKYGYALDAFVASQANQELIQSAMHLQLNDDHYFNGMYVYGGIGNGKTHLLQGMYQLLRDPKRGLRVMYLTAEQFANYFIQALRDKSIPSFHHKFRQLDVLIVDDVEFLEGKQGIQEEFLRTIKQLENSRKRIILSADRHPRSFLQTRSELVDRYLACLVKRIQEPDDQVRQQIVLQRAAHLEISLTTEVAEYLANRFRGSVRELTGAVNCLHAYYLVHQRKITLAIVRNVLVELERACLRIIKPQDIEHVVCEFFQITREEMHSSSRARTLSLPRMIAMYLIRKHTTAAYTEIGRQFGGRNHSTVISAERKVEEWLTQDLTIKLEPNTKSTLASDQSWSIRDILMTLEQKLMAC